MGRIFETENWFNIGFSFHIYLTCTSSPDQKEYYDS
jgi:hypothetical protein